MPGPVSEKIIDSMDMGADFVSKSRDVNNYLHFSVQLVWSGADANDSTIQLEKSNDGVNWHTEGAAITLAAAAGSDMTIEEIDVPWTMFRLVYTANSVTAGTVTAHATIKGGR